jgi:putative metalloprotease
MLKFLPLVLAVAYGLALWHFSAWRLKADLDARSRRLDLADLRPLLARLAAAADVASVEVRVIPDPGLNGLAAPDGRIYLTQGFIDALRAGRVSAEEIAGVVAHELGHVALGHSRRRMIDFSGQNALRFVLAAVVGRFLPGLGIWVANLAASLLAAGLSRRDEFEADAWASALLIKAGIGAGPQKTLFARLDALSGSGSAAGPSAWLRSHPAAAERIAAIEANEVRWGVSDRG